MAIGLQLFLPLVDDTGNIEFGYVEVLIPDDLLRFE